MNKERATKSELSSNLNRKLIIFVSYFTIGMLGVYISVYQYTVLSAAQFFNLSITMMGVLIALQHIGISLSPLLLGGLCDKIGKKKLILIMMTVMVLGMAFAGITQAFTVFLVAILAIGAGFAVTEGTMSAVLADEFFEDFSKHINFSQVAFSVGALCGPLAAQAMINHGVYFKDLYLYIGAVFLVMIVLFTLTKHQYDKGHGNPEHDNISVGKLFKSAILVLLAISIFMYVGIENTIANFADSYFELSQGAPQLSALALSLFWGAMIPSRFLSGIINIDPKKKFIGLSALIFVSVIGAMLVPNHTAKIVFFALSGFGCGPLWPMIMDTTAKNQSASNGQSLNMMMAFSGLGGALVPLLASVVVDNTIQASAYYITAAVVLVMIAFYLSANKKNKPKLSRK